MNVICFPLFLRKAVFWMASISPTAKPICRDIQIPLNCVHNHQSRASNLVFYAAVLSVVRNAPPISRIYTTFVLGLALLILGTRTNL